MSNLEDSRGLCLLYLRLQNEPPLNLGTTIRALSRLQIRHSCVLQDEIIADPEQQTGQYVEADNNSIEASPGK